MSNRNWAWAFLLVCSIGCNSTQPVEPANRSGRGESCAATNDCDKGLLCINQTCVQNDHPVSATAKDCVVVECSSDADCCGGLAADVCGQTCVDDTCVSSNSVCEADADCGGFVCEDSRCVECRDGTTCGAGSCVNNRCQDACTVDEECPLFSACEDDACEETGCQSDRECILFTSDARAKCTKQVCEVPCSSNAQCGELQLCKSGVCVFLGCETDADCRAATGIANLAPGSNVRAICRARE
jgi:hypothetical protein